MCFFFQGWKWFGEIEWALSAEDQTQRPKIVQNHPYLKVKFYTQDSQKFL